jgi:predicted membrane protein
VNGRLVAGLILLLIAIGLLLDRLDVWAFGQVMRTWWPAILILAGLLMLVQAPRGTWGWGLVAIGTLLLLSSLGVIPSIGPFILPAIVLVIALVLLAGAFGRSGKQKPPAVAANKWSRSAFFSGVEERVRGDAFTGGDATAIFGGVDLDLREAQLHKDGAVVEVTVLFGGVGIKVPPGIRVEAECTPIFGGVENKAGSTGDGPVLRITGFVMFGGVEIK